MTATYGQFCPLAKAMEILDERWTLLVVRELLLGSRRFNEIRRGVPRMSPALLAKRLRTLERHGIVVRTGAGYGLTECGRDLHSVVTSLGVWGLRWVTDLGAEDLDPQLLMWDIKRTLPVAHWPAEPSCVAVVFTDLAPRNARWWVVVAHGVPDCCDYDPGVDPCATIIGPLPVLTAIWRGDRTWREAIGAHDLQIDAVAEVRGAIPEWFGQSMLADALAATTVSNRLSN
ncbi:winged helix-turn-helix transcriptional regulator [Flexivirga alba]|uniref:Winged helix-turn-helix transcriptional regulator n=1 Tax=Flexivirga alba TaxID=702742 RepID=A0ABW2AEW3_9MICO